VQIASVVARPATENFEPQDGHAGTDVAWVPTPAALIDMRLDFAKVTAQDFVNGWSFTEQSTT
jgi:hypothetical protein